RFDGVRFVDVSAEIDVVFTGKDYVKLCADSAGIVWMGTSGNGLIQWREGQVSHCLQPGDLQLGAPFPLPIGSCGNGMAVTADGQVLQWANGKSKLLVDASHWGRPISKAISQDKQGDIWFVT